MIQVPKYESIADLIDQSLRKYENQVFSDTETYADLKESIRVISDEWSHFGVKAGELMVIHIQDRLKAVKSLLAALAEGIIPIFLRADTSSEHVTYFLEKAAANYYVNDERVKRFTRVNTPADSSDVAIIACTSGTTGVPSMVIHSHKAIIENIYGILSYMPVLKEDRFLILRDPSYLSVITGEILVALSVGASIAFVNPPVMPSLLVKQIIDEQITIVICASSLIHLSLTPFLVHSKKLSKLRVVKLLGEGADLTTLNHLKKLIPHSEIFHCYGLTEVGPRVTFWSSKRHPELPHCVGKPLPNVKIRILNDHGIVLPYNEPGYVEVSSPSLMQGYVGEEILRDSWLRTGDWGWVDQEGYVYIQCRYDEIIIRGGIKIPIVLIEEALQAHTEVEGAIVASKEFSPYKITIEAMVVTKENSSVTEIELLKWCRTRLSSVMWPHRIVLVDKLPLKSSGKKDRRSLTLLKEVNYETPLGDR